MNTHKKFQKKLYLTSCSLILKLLKKSYTAAVIAALHRQKKNLRQQN